MDRDVTMLWHNGSSTGRAWSTEILNRWTPENRYTDVPALKTVSNSWNANSTRNLFNNSFLRMKNITLSYNFPQPMIKKISLNSLQMFRSKALIPGKGLLQSYAPPRFNHA